MEIKIEKPTEQMLKDRHVRDWHYGETEECYIIEGEVLIETKDGKKVEIKKGDFVTFPQGLSCVWEIKKPIKKHFNFP